MRGVTYYIVSLGVCTRGVHIQINKIKNNFSLIYSPYTQIEHTIRTVSKTNLLIITTNVVTNLNGWFYLLTVDTKPKIWLTIDLMVFIKITCCIGCPWIIIVISKNRNIRPHYSATVEG